MSQTCLIYINYSGQISCSRERFEHTKFPLAEYASDHFGEHIRLAGGDCGDPLQNLLKAFFVSNSVGFQTFCSIEQHQVESRFFLAGEVDPPYPLYYTCKNGLYKTTKSLLEETTKSWLGTLSGCSPRHTKGGECMAVAASYGYLEVVKLLLEHGVDIETNDTSALEQAASGGHLEVVRLLLEYGPNVKVDGEYLARALYLAASDGHLEVVRVLLEHGADVEVDGGYHSSPLQRAASGGHLEVVRLLLEHGANVKVARGLTQPFFKQRHLWPFGSCQVAAGARSRCRGG
jgi:hypothetical protein